MSVPTEDPYEKACASGFQVALDDEKKQLPHLLNEKGCWLVDVKENSTWSQPWYFPRLADKGSEYLS
jgi:hypothetical protein